MVSRPFRNCYWFLKSLCISKGCCTAISVHQTAKHFPPKQENLAGAWSSTWSTLGKLWGGESSCWSCFCFDCCLQGVIYPATLHRLLQLAIRLCLLSAALKRVRTVNCLLCSLWITLACCTLGKHAPWWQGAQDSFIRQVMLLCLPFPMCTHTPACSPHGEHIPGCSFTSSTRAALGGPLCKSQRGKHPSPALAGDAQPADRVTGEEHTQQRGHPLSEKSPWMLRNILFLTARENTDIYLWYWGPVTFCLAHAEELSGLEREEKESR